jgi:hypothetical protein
MRMVLQAYENDRIDLGGKEMVGIGEPKEKAAYLGPSSISAMDLLRQVLPISFLICRINSLGI